MLSETVGRALAIVSGREIAVVDRCLSRPLVLPVAGVHGLERRDARGIIHSRDAADISSIIFDIEKAIGHEVGVAIERKPGAIALHYRLRPELERRCRDIVHGVVEKRSDLCLLQGKMVYEKCRGAATRAAPSMRFYRNRPFSGVGRFSSATTSPTKPDFRGERGTTNSVKVVGCKSSRDFARKICISCAIGLPGSQNEDSAQ